jgi:hypothetical protein
VLRKRRPLQEISQFYGIEVHHGGGSRGGHGHEEGIQMGFVSMGGQENELLNPMVLPFGQKLDKGSMEGSMEGFPLETPSQGISHLGPWER